MTIGEKILNMRKARGWSQEELAAQVGVSRQAVSRWEAGTAKPEADKIIAVCDLFGVTADYLLREQQGEDILCPEAPQEVPAEAAPQPLEAVKKQGTSGGQIIGLVFFALGLLIRCLFEFYAMANPHILHTATRVYQGVAAYVRVYNLQWLEWLLWGLMGLGLLMLLYKPVKVFVEKTFP